MSYYVTKPAKTFFDTFFNTNVEPHYAATPNTDVYSDEKAYHVEVELPGFKKDEISVEIQNGELSISATKKSAEAKSDKTYHIRERSYQKFVRSFSLGDSLDPDSVQAAYDNGVLKVSINKREKAVPKAITIA